MAIMDRLSSMLFGMNGEENEEEEELEEEIGNYSDDYDSEERTAKKSAHFATRRQDTGNKVVNISTTAQLQVVMLQPKSFTDVQQIADHLLEKRTVVLNLEVINKEERRRIIDFLRGVTYAIKGHGKKIAPYAFLLTPYNVGLMGDEIKNDYESGKLRFTSYEDVEDQQ